DEAIPERYLGKIGVVTIFEHAPCVEPALARFLFGGRKACRRRRRTETQTPVIGVKKCLPYGGKGPTMSIVKAPGASAAILSLGAQFPEDNLCQKPAARSSLPETGHREFKSNTTSKFTEPRRKWNCLSS